MLNEYVDLHQYACLTLGIKLCEYRIFKSPRLTAEICKD